MTVLRKTSMSEVKSKSLNDGKHYTGLVKKKSRVKCRCYYVKILRSDKETLLRFAYFDISFEKERE